MIAGGVVRRHSAHAVRNQRASGISTVWRHCGRTILPAGQNPTGMDLSCSFGALSFCCFGDLGVVVGRTAHICDILHTPARFTSSLATPLPRHRLTPPGTLRHQGGSIPIAGAAHTGRTPKTYERFLTHVIPILLPDEVNSRNAARPWR